MTQTGKTPWKLYLRFIDLTCVLWFNSNEFRLLLTRACTGFDGGFEVEEAIRGPDHDKTGTLKLNADNTVAVAA